MNDKDDSAGRKMGQGYTLGPWSAHNMVHEEGRQMTPEEIGEYVANSVRMGSPDRFLFISAKHEDGSDCDVCHVGNGPKGPWNARLIAAAPDMLEALYRALNFIENTESEMGETLESGDIARAAIAKATGGAA